MRIWIFIWVEAGFGVFKGYVYSRKKAEKIKEVLERQADWYECVTVDGWNLRADVGGLEIKDGEVVVKAKLSV